MPDRVSSQGGDEAPLYEVGPEEFIAARDALVRRLRSGGEKADAARVAKLRRPPLTAWALNQVARTAPVLLEELGTAGDGLRSATQRALEGDAAGLRQARAEERAAVDAVVAEAIRRLDQGGYRTTDVMHQRMAATLRAAIVDETVAGQLRHGVLDRDREAPGFGLDALSLPEPVPVSAPARAPARPQPELAERGNRQQQAAKDAERLATIAEELVAEADRLAGAAAMLAAEAHDAMERAREARRQADTAIQVATARRAETTDLA